MAMAGEPQLAQTNPQAYYMWLVRSQRMPAAQAYDLVQQRFGQAKTPEQQQRDAANAQQNNSLAQVGGMVGGAVVTGEAMRGFPNVKDGFGLGSSGGKNIVANAGQNTAPQGGQPTNGAMANAAQQGGAGSAGNAVTPPATEVQSIIMPDGSPGTLMSDGGKVGQNGKIINPDGYSGGSISGQALSGLQIAGGVAQAYNGYKQYQSGEKLGGAANMAGGTFAAAAGAQSLAAGGVAGSLSDYVPGVGTAVAAAQIGQQMLNDEGTTEDRAAKSQYEAQKAALLWIPGYGWMAYAALAAADALTGGKAGEQVMKFNKASDRFTDRIDFGLGKSIRGKLFHQSTKGVQQTHTGQLLQQSDDPQWQNYVAGMRAQVNEGPKDKSKPFAGKYASFDEYKKAGLQADNLTGVYGNLDAFKPDYAEEKGLPHWAKLSFEQQLAVTQRLIDENMYSSKKGEVVIADKEKARSIYEEMAKTNFGVPAGQSGQTVVAVPRPGQGQVARVSPGMYMNDQGRVNRASSVRQSLEQNYRKPSNKGKRK